MANLERMSDGLVVVLLVLQVEKVGGKDDKDGLEKERASDDSPHPGISEDLVKLKKARG